MHNWRFRLMALVLFMIVTIVACSAKTEPAGGIQLIVATNLLAPTDFDTVRFEVRQEVAPRQWSSPLIANDFRVPGETTLPTTFAIVAGKSANQNALIRVIALKGQRPLVLREVQIQIPTTRVAALKFVLASSCAGKLKVDTTGSAQSACADPMQSCQPDTGECGSTVVDPASLPNYNPGDENGVIVPPAGDAAVTTDAADGAVTTGCGDTRTSHDNCGACGVVCGSAESCFDGECDGDKLVDVAAGDGNGCVVTKSGAVYCWGRNQARQLAADTGTTTCGTVRCSPKAIRAVGIDDAVQISVGDGSACAVRKTGNVACWGLNDRGQLGHDPMSDDTCDGSKCNAKPTDVVGLPTTDRIVQVVNGGQATNASVCVRAKSGAVFCWGDNSRGQLGNTTLTPASSSSPVPVVGVTSGAQLIASVGRAGAPATCALTATKTLLCWGSSNQFNIGRDPAGQTAVCSCFPLAAAPTIAGADDVVSMALSDGATVAIKSSGAGVAWGNTNYALHTGASDVAAAIPLLPTVTSVAGAFNHACARTSAGAVWCWGTNDAGQLGLGGLSGNATCIAGPCWTNAKVVTGVTAARIAVGNRSSLAIQDHGAWGWGKNATGGLGHATNLDSPCGSELCALQPTKVEGLPGTK